MKNLRSPVGAAVCLLMMAYTGQTAAQEDEPASVHITIKEAGRITTDTTFELKEGQDPEMVKKMIQHLAGRDEKWKQKEVIIIQKGDDDGERKEQAWVYTDGDDAWHFETDEPGINLDSIKEAHGGGKVLVFKDEDGNITVEELAEEADHEKHFKGEGEDVNVYVIKKGDKEAKMVKKVIIQVEEESEKKMEEKKKEQ